MSYYENQRAAMKQKILTLIAQRPNIRDVEIADIVDIDTDKVRPLIREDILAGLVLVEPVRAPNGLTVEGYRMAGQEPVAEIDVPVTRKPNVPLVAAPAAVELPPPAATVKKTSLAAPLEPAAPNEPVKTKVDIGIEYLASQTEPVPSEFLSRAMGLKKGHHPSSYMLAAIKAGRVIYDPTNKAWSKGQEPLKPAADTAPVERAPIVVPTFIAGKGIVVEPKVAVKVDAATERTPAPPKLDSVVQITPVVAEGGDGVDDPAIFVVYGMGELSDEPPVAALPQRDPGADRFVAGLMSNGELQITKGLEKMVLDEPDARALWEYMRKVAYTLWPTC